jgi:hypothetical protein
MNTHVDQAVDAARSDTMHTSVMFLFLWGHHDADWLCNLPIASLKRQANCLMWQLQRSFLNFKIRATVVQAVYV